MVFPKDNLESCVVILLSSFVDKRICWSLVLRVFKISLILFSNVCILLNNKCCIFVKLSKVSDKTSKDFIESLLLELLLLITSQCLSRANVKALIPKRYREAYIKGERI